MKQVFGKNFHARFRPFPRARGEVPERIEHRIEPEQRGSKLVWNSQQQTEERVVRDAQRPTLWVVDGQQRATALCILFGRKPYWWAEDWDKMLKKYDIRFDIDATQPPYFWVTNAVIRKAKPHRYIPVSQLYGLLYHGFSPSPFRHA